MKKHFTSPKYFFMLWILLLASNPVQCNVSPVSIGFFNFKKSPSSKTFAPPEEEKHRVWLNLTNDQGLFKQILIGYIPGATNGWDHNYDALTMDANKYADFYSINEDRKLVIQGRAVPFNPADTIPLGYRSTIMGNLKISIDHADGNLTDADIYLQDNQTGITHNLKSGPYTFSTLTGTFNDRFVIKYAGKNLGVNESKTIADTFTVVSKGKIIILRSTDKTLREVNVFDITGKLLYSNQKIGDRQLEIHSICSSTQVLVVKTTLENGDIIARKVLF
ncbi:T9SS sorting signal type C domain-containing protein [Flavobacterium sp. 22076]|uniref:T9SS sorting signal type C domain-containing protein n=1 Tax=unclassified Flavobacterium TaxID=196869 RepID=UPI003F82E122